MPNNGSTDFDRRWSMTSAAGRDSDNYPVTWYLKKRGGAQLCLLSAEVPLHRRIPHR